MYDLQRKLWISFNSKRTVCLITYLVYNLVRIKRHNIPQRKKICKWRKEISYDLTTIKMLNTVKYSYKLSY